MRGTWGVWGLFLPEFGVGEGGLVIEIVIIEGSHFHRRAARGLLELRCSKSLSWTCSTPLWAKGLSEAIPSLALPTDSSSCSRSAGLRARRVQLCSAWQGQLLIPLPHSYISVQLVLTAAPEKLRSPSLSVPFPAQAVPPAIPPCHLASLGVGRSAPFLPPSRIYA